MGNVRFVTRVAMVTAALIVGCATPSSLWAKGFLENPRKGSFQSGMGIISGWVCNTSRIDLIIDEAATFEAAYGTDRGDTVKECGDANNGFGFLINWNLFRDGVHTIRARADGVEFGSATFTVTTMMEEEFLRGAEGSYRLSGFPYSFTDVVIRWEQSLQNFVIESIDLNLPGVGAIGP